MRGAGEGRGREADATLRPLTSSRWYFYLHSQSRNEVHGARALPKVGRLVKADVGTKAQTRGLLRSVLHTLIWEIDGGSSALLLHNHMLPGASASANNRAQNSGRPGSLVALSQGPQQSAGSTARGPPPAACFCSRCSTGAQPRPSSDLCLRLLSCYHGRGERLPQRPRGPQRQTRSLSGPLQKKCTNLWSKTRELPGEEGVLLSQCPPFTDPESLLLSATVAILLTLLLGRT